LIAYGAIDSSGYGPDYPPELLYGPRDDLGKLWTFIPTFSTQVFDRFVSGIGLADPPKLGAPILYGLLGLFAIGMLLAVVVRRRPWARRASLAILSAPLLTFVMIGSTSYLRIYRHWSQTPRQSQGRYLYHTVVAFAVLACVGWLCSLRAPGRRVVAVLVLAAGLAVNASAWYLILRTWYAPKVSVNQTADGFHAMLLWSPIAKPVTVLLVAVVPVLAGAAALVAVWVAVRSSVVGGSEPEQPLGLRAPAPDDLGGSALPVARLRVPEVAGEHAS
jgi:hypothetical protein